MGAKLTDLRTRLRLESHAAHQALDDLVSSFDLRSERGLVAFLAMQEAVLWRLIRVGHAKICAAAMVDLAQRAAFDLRALDAEKLHVELPDCEEFCSLATDYVVSGSRLGTKVLQRQWASATCPEARKASAYFTAPDYIECWQDFCTLAKRIDAAAPMADEAVRGTIGIFDLYHNCAKSAQRQYGSVHV